MGIFTEAAQRTQSIPCHTQIVQNRDIFLEQLICRSDPVIVVVANATRKESNMGCGQSVPPANAELVGLWISDDATEVHNLLHNFEFECRNAMYKASRVKKSPAFRPCSGAVFELEPGGYARYIEMDRSTAHMVYSGPITDWNGPGGVWLGCCAGNICCRNGCMHFTADVETRSAGISVTINGRKFSKQVKWTKE